MRRVVGTVVVLLLIAGAFVAGRMQPAGRVDEALQRLQAANAQLANAREQLEFARNDSGDLVAEAKKWKQKFKEIRPRLAAERLSKKRLADLRRSVGPAGARISSATLVPSPGDDLLVVQWSVPGRGAGGVAGLSIWQVANGFDPSLGRTDSWNLVYVADPHPYPSQRLTIGSPSSPSVEHSDASYVTLREARDMTGDGYPDLAITQQNYGSGGCGAVRLVDGRTFDDLFRRDGCDHGLDLRKHVLVYSKATYPKGCQMAHGCGSKDVWMKWYGAGWEVVDVARSVYEE